MSDVVTGEAVVVDVRVAQLPSRVLALLIDMTVQFAAVLAGNWILALFAPVVDPALGAAAAILLTALVLIGYPLIFETLSRGRSLGKLALGLRVVGDDGGPERFRQALVRALAGMVEFWLLGGAPALISSLISQRGKRLGDVFAGTIVISERGPRLQPPLPMPPQLAAWASTLELSQLPDEVATTARQYLVRRDQLAPAVEYDMGLRVAAQVAAYVTPPPPPGVPPYLYLAAVLAERRRREDMRLAAAQGRPYGRPAAGPYPAGAYPAAPPAGAYPAASTGAYPAAPGGPHAPVPAGGQGSWPAVPPGGPAAGSAPSPAGAPHPSPASPAPPAPEQPAAGPGPTPGGFVPPA